MESASTTVTDLANLGSAFSCTDFPVSCTISEMIRSKYPRKTWAFIAESFGLKERTAKHRLAGSTAYTADELRILLRSEDGIDFLVAIMGDAQPKWWRWMTKVMTLAAVRRRQAEDQQEILRLETSADVEIGARRRIKGALNADRNLSAAIARAETAVGFQRPHRNSAGPYRASTGSRISDRALASAGRGGTRAP